MIYAVVSLYIIVYFISWGFIRLLKEGVEAVEHDMDLQDQKIDAIRRLMGR